MGTAAAALAFGFAQGQGFASTCRTGKQHRPSCSGFLCCLESFCKWQGLSRSLWTGNPAPMALSALVNDGLSHGDLGAKSVLPDLFSLT